MPLISPASRKSGDGESVQTLKADLQREKNRVDELKALIASYDGMLESARNNEAVKEALSVPIVTNVADFDETQTLLKPDLIKAVDDIIESIKPHKREESERAALLAFMRLLLKKGLGAAQLYAVGGYALKTYLSDAPVEVSVCFAMNNETNWIARLSSALAHEAASVENNNPRFKIKDMRVLFHEEPRLHVEIGGLSLRISGNDVAALSEVALCEHLDKILPNHVFKRTLILFHAWARLHGILGDEQDGLLTAGFLRGVVLFVFNAFYEHIKSPLEGLWRVFIYLESFQWDSWALSLFGPLEVSSLQSPKLKSITTGPCAWPSGTMPLVTNSTLRKYMPAPGTMKDSGQEKTRAYQICALNVVSAVDPLRNLGLSVFYKKAFEIRRILRTAAQSLRQHAIADPSAVKATLTTQHPLLEALFPLNELMRHEAVLRQRKEGGEGAESEQKSKKFDALDGNFAAIVKNLDHAKEFQTPNLSESELVGLVKGILVKHGSVPVGRMGSLLHEATNNHSLSSMLKERFGGLKKFLLRHHDTFVLGDDHKFNPLIHIVTSSSGVPSTTPSPHTSLPSSIRSSPDTQQHALEKKSSFGDATEQKNHSKPTRVRSSKSARSRSNSQLNVQTTVNGYTSLAQPSREQSTINKGQFGAQLQTGSPYMSPHTQNPSPLLYQPQTPSPRDVVFVTSQPNSFSPSPRDKRNSLLYGGLNTVDAFGNHVSQQPSSMNSGYAATPVFAASPQYAMNAHSSFSSSLHSHTGLHQTKPPLTNALAIDCEMVGVGPGGIKSALARVSIVNIAGDVVYDKYVLPEEPVTDYRTHVSGIRREHISSEVAISFTQAQRETAGIIKNRILIAHGIKSDLEALVINHPKRLIRDTALCKLLCPTRPISLKKLAKTFLDVEVQDGEHDSIVDARTALRLYLAVQGPWENSLRNK